MKLPGHLVTAVWVAGLFFFGLCQPNCRLQDGKAGQDGIPGSDGRPGQKGEKGEPGLQVELSKEALAALKGEIGEPGPIGEIGIKGYQGLLGPPGPLGHPGPSGGGGDSFGDDDTSKAAFSVLQTNTENPNYYSPVTFDGANINVNNDFNLQTGYFECKVAGVYYFVFHAVSEDNLCLKLKAELSTDVKNLMFCDYNKNKVSQVLSGGAVLKLSKKNKVSLQLVKNSAFESNSNKMSSAVFNGFLIFATE